MTEYIITEEQLTELESRKNYQTGQKLIHSSIYQIGKDVRSRQYQNQREKVLDEFADWVDEMVSDGWIIKKLVKNFKKVKTGKGDRE